MTRSLLLGLISGLVMSSVNAYADSAMRDGKEVELTACIDASYDKSYYGWLVFTNHCDVNLNVKWIFHYPGHGGASMTLRPGKHDSTGDSPSEVDKRGGYELAVCLDGFHAAREDGQLWNNVKDSHHCVSDDIHARKTTDSQQSDHLIAKDLLATDENARNKAISSVVASNREKIRTQRDPSVAPKVSYKGGKNGAHPPLGPEQPATMRGKQPKTVQEVVAVETYLANTAADALGRDILVTELYRDPTPPDGDRSAKESRHQIGAIDIATKGDVESMLDEAQLVSAKSGADVLVILEVPVDGKRQLSVHFNNGDFVKAKDDVKRTGGTHLHIQPQDAFSLPEHQPNEDK